MTSTPQDAITHPWRSRFARLHPKTYLGLHGMIGVAACIVLIWAFAFIADEIPEHSTLVRVDDTIVSWLQTHGTESGEAVFYFVSLLGAAVMSALMTAAVLAFAVRRDWLRARALAITALGGPAICNLLKVIFRRGRPESAAEFIVHKSWSFPSSHAMSSIVCYGFVAYLLLERARDRVERVAIILVATILIVAIGFSRLYLGVHYLSDVLAGYLAGAVWLYMCILGYRFAQSRISGVPRYARGSSSG